MSSISVAGDTSGSVTLSAPAVAGTTVLTLPSVSGTVTTDVGVQTLTNKTLTSPTLVTPNIDSAQVATISGTAPLYMCRAWVNFNGTGTVAIRASGNVSSITDNGVGSYRVNFTTAMPDANYSVNITTSSDGVSIVTAGINGTNSAMTTTSLDIVTWSTSAQVDRTVVNVSIFR